MNPNTSKATLHLNLGGAEKSGHDPNCVPENLHGTPTPLAFPPEAPAAPPEPAQALKPVPAPSMPAKPENPNTAPDTKLLNMARRTKRPVQFTFNDGSITTGFVTGFSRYTIKLLGDRILFKHALREMFVLPPVEEDELDEELVGPGSGGAVGSSG